MSTDKKTLELLSRVRLGDEHSFEELILRYRTVVDSASASAVRSMERSDLAVTSESAADMKQEATLALYRAALSYDPDGNGMEVTFGLYAKICIRRALISELRRMSAAKRRADRLSRKADAVERASVGGESAAVLAGLQLDELIKDGRDILSAYENAVLNAYVGGKSITEIAETLGKSQKSVYNALYRIRVKLKEHLHQSDARS